MSSYSLDLERSLQWRPLPFFSPQWDKLISQDAFPDQVVAHGETIFSTDHPRLSGEIYDSTVFLPGTESASNHFPPMTAEYEKMLAVLQDYQPVTRSSGPFPTESSPWSDPSPASLLNDTSSGDANPFIESLDLSDDSLQDDTFDGMLNAIRLAYGNAALDSYDYNFSQSSSSSDASSGSPTLYDRSYEDVGTHYLEDPNLIDSPFFGAYPASYDSSSPSTSEEFTTSEWSDAFPAFALGTFASASDSATTCPSYHGYPSDIDSVAVDHSSDACTTHESSPSSTSYGSCVNEALGDSHFGEGIPAMDEMRETRDPDWQNVEQSAAALTLFFEENENTENINPQQTWNKQSAWDINSFCKEGIDPLTKLFDQDTGAGPSTGSSVAMSMLDIEHARQGQRDVWPNSALAAPETQKRKGKRKAVDAPEPPPPSKRLRTEPSISKAPGKQKGKGKGKKKTVDVPELPSAPKKMHAQSPAQSMDIIISAGSGEGTAYYTPGFEQRTVQSPFIHRFSGEPASSSEQPTSIPSRASALATFRLDEDGNMTPRGVSFIDEVEGWKKKPSR